MAIVKVAYVLRLHLADRFRQTTGAPRQRMARSVDIDQDLLIEQPVGLGHRADHFVVNCSLFLQPQLLSSGVLRHAEIPDFTRDLLVGIIRMQQRIELRAESVVKDFQPRVGVEVIAGAPLHRKRAGKRERHAFARRKGPPDVAFSHQQMFLRMRFALIGHWEGINPGECLRHGLYLDEIQRKTGFLMDKSGAEGLFGIVKINRLAARNPWLTVRFVTSANEAGSAALAMAVSIKASRAGERAFIPCCLILTRKLT